MVRNINIAYMSAKYDSVMEGGGGVQEQLGGGEGTWCLFHIVVIYCLSLSYSGFLLFS